MWRRSLLIAAAALPASGCFIKPDRPGASHDASTSDGAHDAAADSAATTPIVATKVGEAWYSAQGLSPNMSQQQYWVQTTGIVDGDIVVFIANVDNGSNSVWMLPTGFHQLHQIKFGNDGQTFVVGWKLAAGEPNVYTEPYGNGIISGHAVVAVFDVHGANPAGPTSTFTLGTNQTQSPAILPSNGIAISAAHSLLMFAGGVDWDQPDGTSVAMFTEPAGFATLEELSDQGGVMFEWTTQMVSTIAVDAPRTAVPHMASVASSPLRIGIPWTVELAFAPAM
ncbi:MAG: hypothetical protein JO257_29725 [Deltaproteobacteria bacterium]|nr:hypothetical protein [Deltaproteobacteria bacterium]